MESGPGGISSGRDGGAKCERVFGNNIVDHSRIVTFVFVTIYRAETSASTRRV